jgi:hypothetical protein
MGRRVIPLILAAGLFLAGCDDLTQALEDNILKSNGLTEHTLTLVAGSGGSVGPELAYQIKNNVPVSIEAIPDTNVNFLNWEKIDGSGTVAFSDDQSSSTSVILNGGDATIRGNFTTDPTGSISIQNKIPLSGTYYLASRNVNYHLTYSSNATEMKISPTSFAKGTMDNWVSTTLSSSYSFTSDGNKTLYVRFRDTVGNESDLYSDSVYIDSTSPYFTKYEVDQYYPTAYNNPLYVTGATDTYLALDYLAYDAASGVSKVYFSNSTSRPSTAQIQSYTNPPATYPWTVTSGSTRGYYNVYFWVEDLLGNISNYVTEQIRYDDPYEYRWGNNDIDSLSGATIVIRDSNDYSDYLNTFGSGWGYAYSVDEDCYKWGFYGDGTFINSYSDFWAEIEIQFNTSESNLDTIYDVAFYDHNGDEITPSSSSYNSSSKKLIYSVKMPYINTAGSEYYFYLSLARHGETAPYTYSPRYNIFWDFWEDEGM